MGDLFALVGVTPLGFAIEMGDFEMVELFVSKGAHLEAKFAVKLARETPLEFALSIFRFSIAELLIQRGAKTGSITTLDLSLSTVNCVPNFVSKLTNLKSLKLNDKILATLPPSIKKKGDRELLAYFRDLSASDELVAYHSAKVMVLGKEGVGKTHLSRRLRGKSYGKNMSTDGIDVATFRLKGMDLTWFDFGGQEVYYPTHQFFLTSQCLYLVVFNLADPDFKSRVMYWLRSVASFTQDPSRPSKVVVVGTHSDEVSEQRVAFVWAELAPFFEQNGDIVAYVAVSCSSGAGFEALERGIDAAIEVGRLSSIMVPKSFRSIEAWITDPATRRSSPKMAFDAVLKVFGNLKERTVRQALEFLHDMGTCLFFEHLNLVVTDPQWLASTFATLITFSHNWVKDGVVAQKDLTHVWRTSTEEEILQLMHLLKRFQVAFPKKEEGLWVIPSMMRETRHATKPIDFARPDIVDRFQRQYRLDVIPLGLFGRLVARIQEWNIEILETWLTGIVLQDGKQTAEVLVELTGEFQAITINSISTAARSSSSERFLIQRLAEELNSLFEAAFPSRNGPEKPFKVFVACQHCLALEANARGSKSSGGGVNFIPFETCVEMIVTGIETFQCGNVTVSSKMIGDDISFGYVKVFDAKEVVQAKTPFATGGFGNIFMCKIQGRDAVIKELKTENFKQSFGEFQHETSTMSRLVHPNIVELYGVMFSPLRMVLEFCSQGDLFAAVKSKRLMGQLDLQIKIALDIAQGMNFLHSQNPPLAHRDLRSPNILMSSFDVHAPVCAKVSDFGLTLAMTEKLLDPLGAWQWMAPEAQMGDNYTEKCDLYSFGIVVWEIFSGEFPFAEFAKTKEMVLFRQIREEGLRPTLPKDCPKFVSTVVRRAWTNDPQKRPSFQYCVDSLLARAAAKPQVQLDTNYDARPKLASRISRQVCADVKMDGPLCMVLAQDQLVVGYRGGDVAVFDVASAEMVRREQRAHREHVFCVVRVPHSHEVWTGGRDGCISRWTVESPDPASSSSSGGADDSSSSLSSSSASTAPDSSRTSSSVLARSSSGSNSARGKSGSLLSSSSRRATVAVAASADGKREVLALSTIAGKVVAGDAGGRLSIYDANGAALSSLQLPGKDRSPITAFAPAVLLERTVWMAAGNDIFRVSYQEADNTISCSLLIPKAHDRFICSMVFCGKEVWTVHGGGNSVKVWDAKTGAPKGELHLPKPRMHAHCMELVNLRGEPKMWIGSDDEIVVFDVKRKLALQTLASPMDGDVLCLAQTGLNAVWAGVRHKDDTGSLVWWNLN